MHRFKELNIWKKSRVFASAIYKATASFLSEEKIGLTNQLRLAAVSVVSNIAEGTSRQSNKEFGFFIKITTGSDNEIDSQLLIATDLEFITQEDHAILDLELQSIIKMMSKFKSTLK